MITQLLQLLLSLLQTGVFLGELLTTKGQGLYLCLLFSMVDVNQGLGDIKTEIGTVIAWAFDYGRQLLHTGNQIVREDATEENGFLTLRAVQLGEQSPQGIENREGF